MADEITVGGITVPITHPDKVLFPADGITKADLARYYADVADSDAALAAGPADHHGPLPGRSGRPAVLPEERPRVLS